FCTGIGCPQRGQQASGPQANIAADRVAGPPGGRQVSGPIKAKWRAPDSPGGATGLGPSGRSGGRRTPRWSDRSRDPQARRTAGRTGGWSDRSRAPRRSDRSAAGDWTAGALTPESPGGATRSWHATGSESRQDSGLRVNWHDRWHWVRHWIVWLDSGHRVTRHQVIWLDSGHRVIWQGSGL
ncbi:unnamed protein product, partial [Staurois parvus]